MKRKLAPTASALAFALMGASTLFLSAPANAVTDPFPSAPTCAVASDHVTIKLNSSGNSVKEAQCLLNKHGAKLVVDGKFGSATDTAVRNFQRSKGLTADGVVGYNTWKALIGGTTSTPPSSSTRDQKVNTVINYAKAQLGKPYKLGATGPSSFDCSGLTSKAYAQVGITTPRTADAQGNAYRQVSKAQALPGDLVHWSGHVGIYLGNGKVIDAGTTPHAVTIRNIWGSPTFHRVIP